MQAAKAERALQAEVAKVEEGARRFGRPTLCQAAFKGKQRVEEILLQRGASVDEVLPCFRPPLEYCIIFVCSVWNKVWYA